MHSHEPTDVMVKHGSIRRRAESGADHDPGPEQHPLLKLQRQVGNAQIARLLAQRQAPEEEAIQAKHDPGVIHREGAPEEEELQAKHDPALAQREGAPEEEEIQAKHDPSLMQREGAPEEEELQAKHDPALAQRDPGEAGPEVGMEGGPISEQLSSRIQSKKGSGSSLDSGTRGSMEQAFGTSFADVRVHQDAEADSLNRSISAKAFTTGSDIFFSQNANPSDSQLLAHELTHVVQQRGMGSGGGSMTVGPAGDSHEQAADSAASAVASGAASAQRIVDDGVAPAALAREAAPEEEEMPAS